MICEYWMQQQYYRILCELPDFMSTSMWTVVCVSSFQLHSPKKSVENNVKRSWTIRMSEATRCSISYSHHILARQIGCRLMLHLFMEHTVAHCLYTESAIICGHCFNLANNHFAWVALRIHNYLYTTKNSQTYVTVYKSHRDDEKKSSQINEQP